ncbi:MAG: glycoside hydrolase family 9 protein [Limisphaerales bacterium]
MPAIGDHGLRVLSPTVLEITLISTKQKDPARVSAWDFVNNFVASIPAASQFTVTVNGIPVGVERVGFKRRPLHAPETPGGLRIGNYLYLTLTDPVPVSATVEVKNPNSALWASSMQFTSTAIWDRYSPAVHVNQVGYMPDVPKKAMVGYYLGSLGELPVPSTAGFRLLNAKTKASVYEGNLRQRKDIGFGATPLPYQQVYEADFTAFQTPGEYVLWVPDLGTSFPFRINDGITANFARTFALGLYHQRCGGPNELPYTRHTHADCHTAAVDVPTMDPTFAKTQEFLSVVTEDYRTGDFGNRHTAPRLQNVAASLYPLQRQGKIDARGGHHDAGDYSKYTINSAGLIHFLVFAADSMAGVGALDNLGLPESGDGKSDILQEAKWEADFLAKLQDTDGGFYFLVYPKDQRYENRVLPDKGAPQVVWPKTTAVTAAAVAALAEAGSSPLMKAQFPNEAAMYLQKAMLGWNFLMNAIGRFGKDGAYQKITHYGNQFLHDDELAWAASALFAATGESQYEQKLYEFLPNPNDPNTRRWTWWKLFEGYGCAIRTYAFAARSGRLQASRLNGNYLAKCQSEIIDAADDHTRFSQQSAYGTSLPEGNKAQNNAGWYFSSERAFDITVAYQLSPLPEYREAVTANFNYEAGSNPLNMTFITGIGWKRQRDIVHQYAWNDHRILPPSGIPLGNVQQTGYGYLETYISPVHGRDELQFLSYPNHNGSSAPYAFYDRWTDMINTTAEFVVMDQARSLASLAFWMAQGSKKSQPWKPILGQVSASANIHADAPASLVVSAPGIDMTEAHVTWEIRYQEPLIGNPVIFTPTFSGDHWVEAEALLPDGRRIVARTNISASTSANIPPNTFQSAPLAVSADMLGLYHFDGNSSDASGKRPAMTLKGNARVDSSNLGWMAQRTGGAMRFLDLGDTATLQIPVAAFGITPQTTAVVLEGMIYVNEYKGWDRDVAKLFSLEETWNAGLQLIEDKYAGPYVKCGAVLSIPKAQLTALTTKTWHHISMAITRSGYVIKINGQTIVSVASADLNNWGRGQTVTLTMGNFDGWIDEVVVRSSNTLNSNTATLTPVSASSSGFRLRVTGQAGSTYVIQGSEDTKTWSNVGTVSLTSSTGEFLDSTRTPGSRMYRAVRQ